MPLLSHDRSAIRTLERQSRKTATPTLRLFDLICLAYRNGGMDESSCDQVRKKLIATPDEFVPQAFKHASFADGLVNYDLRLFDSAGSAGAPPPCAHYCDPYFLTKI